MTDSRKRSRFASRLEELHDADNDRASEFGDLAVSFFVPALFGIAIAVVTSLETWLKPNLRGWQHAGAAAVLVACLGLLWRRGRHRS